MRPYDLIFPLPCNLSFAESVVTMTLHILDDIWFGSGVKIMSKEAKSIRPTVEGAAI